jgi:serine/threonine protein kinase
LHVFRYYSSNQLSARSDVYSFGVVLLEIITGRPPIVTGIEGSNLVQWVHHKLSGGDIESIVDPRIQDQYDINSVWKVAELACKCTKPTSSRRPTMSAVVIELKESLDFEMPMEEIRSQRTDKSPTDVSQNSNIELAYMGSMQMIGPNVR